jgi:hypothetical protein
MFQPSERTVHHPDIIQAYFRRATFEEEERIMNTKHTVLLAAGLVAGLALASSETFAAGPMIALRSEVPRRSWRRRLLCADAP